MYTEKLNKKQPNSMITGRLEANHGPILSNTQYAIVRRKVKASSARDLRMGRERLN